jgi:predicted anti-sigma-YlaC factor YlaD
MKRTNKNCAEMDKKLASLLLDPAAAPAALPAKVQMHLAECDRCRRELDELRSTMALLDSWKAPEPNPYFLTRFEARLREEREAAPAGWLKGGIALLRARFAYGPAAHVRPLAAMALTVLLLLGGGTYLGISDWNQPPAPPIQAAVVHDLQTMDNNAQLLDQLEDLSNTN